MAIFGKCANCGATLIGGGKEGEARFCSNQCRDFHSHPGFCEQCIAETTAEGLGGTFSVNLIFGTHLMGWGSQPCPRCRSKVMRKWLWILIPLIPVSAKHLVLYQTRTHYFSRKLKIN
jgi:endogenous inhibitor of DNA gyrase (YacG/DUF329 family)